jgi:hypothetical protein
VNQVNLTFPDAAEGRVLSFCSGSHPFRVMTTSQLTSSKSPGRDSFLRRTMAAVTSDSNTNQRGALRLQVLAHSQCSNGSGSLVYNCYSQESFLTELACADVILHVD